MLDEAKRKALKEEQRRRRAIGRRAAATAKKAGTDIKEAKKVAAKEEQKSRKKNKSKEKAPKDKKKNKTSGKGNADKDVTELDDELARLEAELAGLDDDLDEGESPMDSAKAVGGQAKSKKEKRSAKEVVAEEAAEIPEKKKSRKEDKALSQDAAVEDVDPAEAKRRRKEEKRLAKAKAGDSEKSSANIDDVGRAKQTIKEKKTPNEASKSLMADADNPYRLFVGGLAWKIDSETLRRDFEECGTVADCKVLFGDDGRSRGIAFITMADKAGYDAAMKYDGEMYAGRKLSICARDDSHGKGRQSTRNPKGGGKGVGERPLGCKSIVVKGLSYAVTSDDLYECFKSCGGIGPENVNLLTEGDTGKSRGVAFVDFSSERAVDDAAKLSETVLKGRAFFIRYSDKR